MTDKKPKQSNLISETPGEIKPDISEKSLRQYWLFFSGQLFSLFGSSVVQFAIIWWITITSDAKYPGQTGLILSLAAVAGFAPFILTSLFAGVLVDRWNRKIVIGVADFIQAAVTVILLFTFYIGKATIPVVLTILAIRAIAQGFHNPATQAIIPIMVPKEKFTRVNSYQYLFNSAINLIGPVIGAVLIEWTGVENIATILWLDVISFVIAVIPLAIINIPDITKKKREEGNLSFRREFKEGISFITQSKGLLPLLLTFTLLNILINPIFMLLPLIAIDPKLLNGTASTLAIIMVGLQAGTFTGSFILSRKKLFSNNSMGVYLGQVLNYASLIGLTIGAAMGNIWIAAVSAYISGFALPVVNIHSQNIWLAVVPPELQGRVMSVRQTIAWILIPVANLAAGYITDILGIVPLFLTMTLTGLVAIITAWYTTSLSQVEQKLGINQTTSNESPTEIGETSPQTS